MEINVVELVVQAGALGVTALLLYGLWKYGAAFVSRLMDNLDQQARNNEASIRVQAETAATLAALCNEVKNCKATMGDGQEQQGEVVGVLEDLSEKLKGHEDRAQKRHEQQMEHADERHGELVKTLQGMNGQS